MYGENSNFLINLFSPQFYSFMLSVLYLYSSRLLYLIFVEGQD